MQELIGRIQSGKRENITVKMFIVFSRKPHVNIYSFLWTVDIKWKLVAGLKVSGVRSPGLAKLYNLVCLGFGK